MTTATHCGRIGVCGLCCFVQHQIAGCEEPHQTYAEAAVALEVSEGSIKVAVHRLRRRFRDLVRDEIAQTVSSPDQVDEELRYLWSAVGRW